VCCLLLAVSAMRLTLCVCGVCARYIVNEQVNGAMLALTGVSVAVMFLAPAKRIGESPSAVAVATAMLPAFVFYVWFAAFVLQRQSSCSAR
jgi:hypothetical protein